MPGVKDSSCISGETEKWKTHGDRARALPSRPQGHGDPPQSPAAECVLGVPGKGVFLRERQAPEQSEARLAARWITVGGPHGRESSEDSDSERRGSSHRGPTLAALRVFHRVCPMPGLFALKLQCQGRGASQRARPRRRPVYPPARARGEALPCFGSRWLAVGQWGRQGQGRYWLQATITQRAREGRGLSREGHDCENFSMPSDAIFSLFCFV